MMTFKECKELIFSDLARLTTANKRGSILRCLITNASFKVTFWFRVASWLCGCNSFMASVSLLVVAIIRKHYEYKTGIQLGTGTDIGRGLFFPHFSCIVINGGAIIGDNVTIFQGVTVGSVRGKGTPVIGDNVVLSAHSQIIGKVRIGNNVMVGAGAVVVNDVPDNAVVIGVPAKVVSYKGKHLVSFYCKHND